MRLTSASMRGVGLLDTNGKDSSEYSGVAFGGDRDYVSGDRPRLCDRVRLRFLARCFRASNPWLSSAESEDEDECSFSVRTTIFTLGQ
ncbi:hypothetical protein KIN20_014020 [Parelaphostrongylus tenuis]|uniref:Uncharacterized protein n=1 Tax=Parelaphostrongylus tenuis TaxID=148309 RepID=A0AAD5N2Q5_PARTN|nr:hypothetical protein KIN20_014020 [Parelaphostrongylus tenuis]